MFIINCSKSNSNIMTEVLGNLNLKYVGTTKLAADIHPHKSSKQ